MALEIVDSLEFDAVYGTEPAIVHVSGDVYAIAYSGTGADGWLITVNIAANGTIGSIIDSEEFDAINCNDPEIIHISGTVFAIAYTGEATDGYVKTVDIAANGTIGSIIDTLEFDATNSINSQSFLHILGTIYAIGYEQSSSAGILITLDIDNSGNIGAAPIDSLTFDTSVGYGPYVVHVTGQIYALGYRAGDGDGQLITVNIDVAGNISAVIDQIEFETGLISFRPIILNVSGTIFALVYTGTDGDGWLKTVSIDGFGNIGAIIDTFEFDPDLGYTPAFIHWKDNYYAIAYGGPDADGYIITLTIASNGTIGSVEDSLEFDESYGLYARIILVDSDVFAIPYRGPDTNGWLKTVGFKAAVVGRSHAYMIG